MLLRYPIIRRMMKMRVDSHVHSHNSHDCKCQIDDMARAAAQKGLDGITVTDHCDVILWRDVDITKSILSSVKEAK